MIEFSFALFLLLFVAVGLASAFRARKSRNDYYLASRDVRPWLAGLSAVATNNSGYMFIGVIGFTYTAGMAATVEAPRPPSSVRIAALTSCPR